LPYDFLAIHPNPDEWELNYDLSGEDVIFVDILLPGKCTFSESLEMIGLARA